MGGRGSASSGYKGWYKNDTDEIRLKRLNDFTRKSKLTNEQKQVLLKRMEKDPAYLNKKGSNIIDTIQNRYGKYATSDTGYITIGDKEDAKEALAEMKKKGARYGIFQDASTTYNRFSREWEIYHGW